ncbi:MAG: glycosyltransferase family 39 protein [Elusimicrobiota bacterium]
MKRRPASSLPLSVPALAASTVLCVWTVWAAVAFRRQGVTFVPSDWRSFLGLLSDLPRILHAGLGRDLLWVAAMWLLFGGVGGVLARWIGLAGMTRAERRLLSAGLGAGTVSLILLGLGMAGLWSPELLRGLFFGGLAVLAASAIRRWRRRRKAGGSAPAEETDVALPQVARRGLWENAAVVLIAVAALLNVVTTAAPEIFYDSLVYHLALPKLFLLRGEIMATPGNVFSGTPLGLQSLYGLALALSGEGLAALLHCSFGLGAAAALWAWMRRHASDAAGLLAALVFYLCPVALYASWHCGVDLGASFYIALALVALPQGLAGRQVERPLAWPLAAGLLAGFAMGVKYNVLPVGAAFVLVRFWLGRRAGRPARETFWMAAAAALAFAPWLVKNLVFYGNPVYPFFHQALGWAAPAHWSAFMEAAGSRDLAATFGSADGWKAFLTHPWTYSVGDWPAGDWAGPAFLLLIPWAFFLKWTPAPGRPHTAAWTAVAVLAAAGYLSWCLASRLVRFVLPVLPLLAGVVALAVQRGAFPGWLRRAGWTLAIMACLFDLQVVLRQGEMIGQWDVLRGRLERAEYLKRQHVTYGLPYYAAMEFVNESLPLDAKVLFLGESRAYYCERDFIAATVFDHNPFWVAVRAARSADELHAAVRGLGVTHVFLSARQMLYRADAEAVMPKDLIRGEVFGEFWRRRLKKLFEDREDGGENPRWLTVYEVLDSPNEDPAAFPENPARVVLDFQRRKRP